MRLTVLDNQGNAAQVTTLVTIGDPSGLPGAPRNLRITPGPESRDAGPTAGSAAPSRRGRARAGVGHPGSLHGRRRFGRCFSTTRPTLVDHRSVSEFDRLDDRQIEAAARRRLTVRTASIGWGIDQGLNCLMNNFPGRKRRPYACDKGLPAEQVVHGAKYDRRNWAFEIRGNPGWYGKVSDFVDRLDQPKGAEALDVVGFNFNYSDGVPTSDILDHFFSTAGGGKVGNVATLEALEKRHPDMTFVWWTMALPRQSSTVMQQFNERLRAYARERNKDLFDLADIESHRPDGSACVDNREGASRRSARTTPTNVTAGT